MGQKTVIIGIIAVIIAGILGLVFLISGIGPDDSANPATSAKTVVDKELISVSDIVSDPLVYDGLTVKVESTVTDWIDKRSFIFNSRSGNGGLFGSNKVSSLLIIQKEPFRLSKNVAENELGLGELETVQVVGRVRIMTKAELEKELGRNFDDTKENIYDDRIEYDDNLIYNWKKRPVILVHRVEKPQISPK